MAIRNFVPKINKENRTIGTLLKKWLKGFFYDLHITDPDRIEYENYKAEIKEKIKLQKKDVGLIQ